MLKGGIYPVQHINFWNIFMKKLLLPLALLAFIAPSANAYRDEKKGICFEVNPYISNNTDNPKQLRAGELDKNQLHGFEVRFLNNSPQPITIALEHVGYKSVTLEEIDEIFGWNKKKASIEAAIAYVGWSLLGLSKIKNKEIILNPLGCLVLFASALNPYYWKQHGFLKGFAASVTSCLPAIAGCVPTVLVTKNFLASFSLGAAPAKVGTQYAMMRHFDKQNMDKVKAQYLHEPIMLAPGQITTKLVYVRNDEEFQRVRMNNTPINFTCVTPQNKAIVFKVPAGAL